MTLVVADSQVLPLLKLSVRYIIEECPVGITSIGREERYYEVTLF